MTVHYVPAGVELYTSKSQLLIKHEKNKQERTEFGPKYKRWFTTDKTVTLSKSTSVNGIAVQELGDMIVPIFSATNIAACGLSKVLANPVHKKFSNRSYKALGIESIVDSGGFQMLTSVVDFVSPDDVIKRYNINADIGMPLDLPVPAHMEPFFFDIATKLIRANDDYILGKLNPNVDLALISHGTSLDLRRRRLDALDRETNVVAIAGLNMNMALSKTQDAHFAVLENLMYVIQRYHKTTRYFHVLGVTSKLWVFIYALIDALGYVKEIGADSVSHRLAALVGAYDTMNFDQIQLDRNLAYHKPSSCSCPACFAIDDLRLLQGCEVLEAHNLWVRAKQTELLCDMAKGYIQGSVPLAEIHKTLGLSLSVTKLQHMVNYVTNIVGKDKFTPFGKKNKTTTLFSSKPVKVTKVPDEHKKQYEHLLKVVKNYETFHGVSFS